MAIQELFVAKPNLNLPPFPHVEHYLESHFSDKIETLEKRVLKPVRINYSSQRALLFSLWGTESGIVFDGEGNPRGTLDEQIIQKVGFRSMRDFGLNQNTLLSRDRHPSSVAPSIIEETSVYPSRTEGLVFESINTYNLPSQECTSTKWWVCDVGPRFKVAPERLFSL